MMQSFLSEQDGYRTGSSVDGSLVQPIIHRIHQRNSTVPGYGLGELGSGEAVLFGSSGHLRPALKQALYGELLL